MGRASNARTVALVASAGIIIGSIGPWQATFIADIGGTEGDGVITLILGVVAALLVFTRLPGSRWLWIASALAVVCAIVGVADIATMSSNEEELFGQKTDLVDPGWGIWLMTATSVVLVFAAYWLYSEDVTGQDQAA